MSLEILVPALLALAVVYIHELKLKSKVRTAAYEIEIEGVKRTLTQEEKENMLVEEVKKEKYLATAQKIKNLAFPELKKASKSIGDAIYGKNNFNELEHEERKKNE